MVELRKQFWQSFGSKDLKQAQQLFEKMSNDEKQSLLAELFQKCQYQTQPHSVSVIFRELHEGKTFSDFYKGWFPAEETIQPINEQGLLYQQFFPAPVRVIQATNLQNPKEIVSVSFNWLTEEQAANLWNEVNKKSNADRGTAISEVADRTKWGIYKVESDDNLGTPF